MHSEADISKLAILGWHCRYDLEMGLKQVLDKEKEVYGNSKE